MSVRFDARLHELISYQGLSILILAEASGAVFYNINSQLAYLCIEVGMTVIYTLLVVGRLFIYRRQMESFMGEDHLRTYNKIMTMVVESAAVYSVLGVIFIISFALHSDITNLVFLAISHVQVSVKSLPEDCLNDGHFSRPLHNFTSSSVLLRDGP